CDPPLAEADIDYLAERAFGAKNSEGWEEPVDTDKMKDAGNWRSANATPRDWPEPQPLPLGLPPVAPFEFHLLPQSLRRWAEDIVDRMRCPADYIGVSIMAGIATVVGRKIAIRPKEYDDWSVIPNLWAFLIGRPGVLKSPAMEEALKPIKRLVARAIDEHRQV